MPRCCEHLSEFVEHRPVAAQLLKGRVTCGVQNPHLRRGPGHLPQASPRESPVRG